MEESPDCCGNGLRKEYGALVCNPEQVSHNDCGVSE